MRNTEDIGYKTIIGRLVKVNQPNGHAHPKTQSNCRLVSELDTNLLFSFSALTFCATTEWKTLFVYPTFRIEKIKTKPATEKYTTFTFHPTIFLPVKKVLSRAHFS